MSAYLINRDGQELGSYEISQIQDGLKTGVLKATDWGWRDGMAGWQALSDIAGTAATPAPTATAAPQTKAFPAPTGTALTKPAGVKPEGLNPYAAPTANTQPAGSSGVVPPDVLKELQGTKPWVRFISVLMWIGCAAFLLVIVFNLFFGAAITKAGGAQAGAAYMIGTTIGYGLMALLVLYPTLKLSKYASNIGRLANSRSFSDLAAALAEQRRFWKFYGILMIIYLSFAVLFVILIVAGVGIGSMAR